MAREYSYTRTGVIPINTVLLGPIDADNFKGLSFHCTSMGTTGNIKLQGSNDGLTWHDLQHFDAAGATGPGTVINAAKLGWCNLTARHVRFLLSVATTAGTTTVYVRLLKEELSELPSGLSQVAVASAVLSSGWNVIGKVWRDISPTLGNGPTLLYHRLLSAAASTNATSVKNGAGRLVKIRGYNAKAALVYLKLYNKASAPTVGTDTPIMTIPLKASSDFDFDMQVLGANFSTGIAYALTGAVTDADTTALVAGDILGLNIIYI